MIRRVGSALLVLLFAIACQTGASDEEQILMVYETYKQGVINSTGVSAASVLTPGSYDFYAKIRDHALYATKEELEIVSGLEFFTAIMIRGRIDAEELVQMSGEDIIALQIDRGWTSQGAVSGITLGEITVNGNRASSTIEGAQGAGPVEFEFEKVDGVWRLDLAAFSQEAGKALDAIFLQVQGSRADSVLQMLEMGGITVDPETIWTPPMSRNP